MLRANLLQPLSNEQMIKSRQDLVQIFLDDKTLYDTMCE
jgi:DNA mismatch repair ATPase MutS